MAREAAGSPGTQPTTGFVQMQPNPSGIDGLQRENIVVERHILSVNLTPENGDVVGYDVKPKLVMDVTKDVMDNWLEPIFRSSLKHSGGTGLSKFYPSAVVNGSPTRGPSRPSAPSRPASWCAATASPTRRTTACTS